MLLPVGCTGASGLGGRKLGLPVYEMHCVNNYGLFMLRELIGAFGLLQAELVTHGLVVSRAAIALFLKFCLFYSCYAHVPHGNSVL